MSYEIGGLIPASFVPFKQDQSIHKEGFQGHIAELSENDFVSGILVNGHAGEQYALSSDERESLVRLAAEVSDKPIYSGVQGNNVSDILSEINRIEVAGAEAVMVETPETPIHGRIETAKYYFDKVAEGSNLPIVVFQIAKRSGREFDPATLAELASIENVIGIKEGVWDVNHTMSDVHAVEQSDANVSFLMGNDEHLLPGYILKSDGSVVELGAAFPDLIGRLLAAVNEGNITQARSIHHKVEDINNVIYQDPVYDSSIRLKVALEYQGRLPTSLPRAPAQPIPEQEVKQIKQLLKNKNLV